MPIHPTFNFLPCSRSKSHYASPNYHRPTTMLHGLLDMLRSNALSISNPTPWPTIWVKHISIRLVIKIYAFSSMVQFSYLWANLGHVRTCLRLKMASFVAFVHPIQPLLKHVLQWCQTTIYLFQIEDVLLPQMQFQVDLQLQEWHNASCLGLQEALDALLIVF